MNRHTHHRLGRGLMLLVLIVTLLAAGSSLAWASEEPGNDSRFAGPDAVWDAPFIFITKQSSSSIKLSWLHSATAITLYQVWRSEAPYFVPPAAGTMIDSVTFPSGPYGLDTPFAYVDNGACGYFIVNGAPQTCKPQSPPVTVLGDVDHNYFWVVRAGDPTPDYEYNNRVGEFDFALVPGS